MKKVGVAFVVILACVYYYAIVVGIASEQTKKGNDYGLWGLANRYTDQHKADSFFALAHHYWEKHDKTIKWVPKFLRP